MRKQVRHKLQITWRIPEENDKKGKGRNDHGACKANV